MKGKFILIIAALSLGAFIMSQQTSTSEDIEAQFTAHVQKYRRSYFSKQEYAFRLGVFKANVNHVAMLNSNPNDEAVYEINHMGDWTQEQRDRLKGAIKPEEETEDIKVVNLKSNVANVDWRNHTPQVVGAIRNQEDCGDCYAFSAAETIASEFAIQGAPLVVLSPQQITDCSGAYGNYGCRGGWPQKAMEYAKATKGLASETEYPYAGVQTACKVTGMKMYDPIQSYWRVAQGNSPLMGAITKAPVSIAVDATNWDFYKTGIFSNCGNQLDHAVMVVGFTQEMWIVRNSWGPTWGESGYITLKMGNTCDIWANAYLAIDDT